MNWVFILIILVLGLGMGGWASIKTMDEKVKEFGAVVLWYSILATRVLPG